MYAAKLSAQIVANFERDYSLITAELAIADNKAFQICHAHRLPQKKLAAFDVQRCPSPNNACRIGRKVHRQPPQ